jgi:PAS domain-containing protein
MILDAEGTIRYITPAARRLLQYGPEEPLMPCFFSHIHGQNIYQVMRDIADMVCYGKPRAGWFLRIRTGRGGWQWFRTTVTNQLNCDVPSIKVVVSDLRES